MFQEKIESFLRNSLQKIISEKLSVCDDDLARIKPYLLEYPKEKSFGDISSPCALKLASILKTPPLKISARIIGFLKEDIGRGEFKGYIEKVESAAGGFINFYLSKEYFYSSLKEINSPPENLYPGPSDKKRLLIEFVSANPTGPLSIAHARQAAVGDALANILEFLGHRVSREYYLNDEGNQINILGNSIWLRLNELKGNDIEFPQDHYQGEYIIDLAKELLSSSLSVNYSQENCGEYGVKRILEMIRKDLEDFGVSFDSWYSQADLQKSQKINRVISLLRDKGLAYDSEGAVWFASSGLGDDKDRVIVKSDGSYTYLAPDIAYHQDKFQRGFDWLINLWGPDHHGYIPRIKAAVEAIGRDREALSVIIVQLAALFRDGKAVSMSTRRGEYITLRQVLDEVGVDASRFFFLTRKTDSHLDFDLELAKKQSSENPVYYIQYAHARICNILANSQADTRKIISAPGHLLKEARELDLLKIISKFRQCLKIAEIQLDPYCLSAYLQELSEGFHRFYDIHRVLIDDEELKLSRLNLILACKNVLSLGLKLLGISAPRRM